MEPGAVTLARSKGRRGLETEFTHVAKNSVSQAYVLNPNKNSSQGLRPRRAPCLCAHQALPRARCSELAQRGRRDLPRGPASPGRTRFLVQLAWSVSFRVRRCPKHGCSSIFSDLRGPPNEWWIGQKRGRPGDSRACG